ncbi:unnamed protein product, partial [Prorocentrum cordatum]
RRGIAACRAGAQPLSPCRVPRLAAQRGRRQREAGGPLAGGLPPGGRHPAG